MSDFVNRCKFYAASTGTGNFVAESAVQGYRLPDDSDAVDTNTYSYVAETLDGLEWEIGTGVYTTSDNTIVRNVLSSSNSDALVNFSTPPVVAFTILAEDLTDIDNNKTLTVSSRTVLKNIDPNEYSTVYLTEPSRRGVWNYVLGDYSGQVSGDTNEGAYLAANSVSSSVGAWVRENTSKIASGTNGIGVSLNEGASGDVWYTGRSLTGARSSGTSGLNLALDPSAFKFDVRFDDSDCGTNFSRGLFGRIVFGGSAAKGGRIGTLGVVLHNNGITNSSNLNRNYLGVLGLASSEDGDGGTNLTSGSKGAYFGMNGVVELHAGATNIFNASGSEINVYSHASATAKYVTGQQIAGFCNADPGGDVFAGLTVGGGNDGTYNHIGWRTGVLITDFNGGLALQSTATLLGTYWTAGGTKTIDKGIDLTGFVCSTFAYKSTGFEVDGSGKVTTNGQIVFPATQNASTNANTLDDYEEGSWTPVYTYVTPGDQNIGYAAQLGRYIKIGKQVTLFFDIQLNTHTWTTASGALRITGIPFTANSTIIAAGSVIFTGINKATYTQINPRIAANGTFITFLASGMGVGVGTVSAADTTSGSTVFLQGSITYESAS